MNRPARLLQFAVLNDWVVENLRVLGDWRQKYHLAYQPSQCAPEVLDALAVGAVRRGTPAEILRIDGDHAVKVGDVEIEAVRAFSGYYRFDFRMTSVAPDAKGPLLDYPFDEPLCRFK